jgi:hypothetical protein
VEGVILRLQTFSHCFFLVWQRYKKGGFPK